MFFTAKSQAPDGIKILPKELQDQYYPTKHFDTLYKYARMEFEFGGIDKNDFNKWQNDFRPRLKQLLGLNKLELQLANYAPHTEKKGSEERDDFILERWIIWTEPDIPLPVVVLIPKGKKGKFPLVVTTHGHGKNADLYEGIYPKIIDKKISEQTEISIAVQAVSEGYIAIAPTMRAFGDTRTEYDKENNITAVSQLFSGVF